MPILVNLDVMMARRKISAGELAIDTGDLSRILGRPTAPIIDTLRAGA